MKNLFLKFAIVVMIISYDVNFLFAQQFMNRYPVSDFTRLFVSGNSTVILQQDSTNYIELPDNIDITSVFDNQIKNSKLTLNSNFRVVVGYKKLSEINIKGTGKIECINTMNTEYLELVCGGVGKTELILNCKTIDVNSSSVGLLVLKGSADTLSIKNSGTGRVKAYDLVAQTVNVNNSGVGNIEVTAEQTLNIVSTGIGNVNYMGTPTINQKLDNQYLSSVKKYGEKDTTKFRIGKKRIIIVSDNDDLSKLELERKRIETEIGIQKRGVDSLKSVLNNKKQLTDSLVVDSLSIVINRRLLQIESNEEKLTEINQKIGILLNEFDNNENHDKQSNQNYENYGQIKNHRGKKEYDPDGHWGGFTFGLNNFMNNSFEMTLPQNGEFLELKPTSFSFGYNVFDIDFPIIPKHALIITGLGAVWSNYQFENDITLRQNDAGFVEGFVDSNIDLRYSSLNTCHLQIPLIFEFNTKTRNENIFIGAGVIGGYRLMTKTIQKLENEPIDNKHISHESLQVSPLRYDLTVRMGYQHLYLYGNYSMVSLFKKDKGPEVYPFTFGLGIAF